MSAASPPDVGMFVRIPVGRRLVHRLFNLFPRLETPPFERQRLEGLPPRFNQVQVGGVGGLEDKLPARIGQIEE